LPAPENAPELKVFDMNEDDALPVPTGKAKVKAEDASALPAQLGQKLRNLFADVESQPVPDRLSQLLEALAAKEKNPE
jgi:Anti-sigma factor NepR